MRTTRLVKLCPNRNFTMQICRLCLHESEDDLISVLDAEQDLVGLIKDCVSIEISEQEQDILPTTACESCIQKVKDWHVFKDNCIKSNEVLLVKAALKKEAILAASQEIIQLEWSDGDESNSEDDQKYLLGEDDIIFDKSNCCIERVSYIYMCEICSTEFDNCFEYLDHQSSHNGADKFKCDKCSEIFSNREDLVEHDKNHKRPCPKCSKMIMQSSMKLHLIKHTDRYKCSQCAICCNSRAALRQHVITIHTNQRNYICETCGKRFASKSGMIVHLRSHNEERLYTCKLCNYTGRTASAVYVHMSTHANEVCVCGVCSKVFKSNRNLKDHLRRVHSKEKKHKCSYCDKKFVDRYMLKVHVRCHTGVRPYQCKLCDKAFIRSDGLKEHMATHGQRRWYECAICIRKFASKKGVTRHHCSGYNNN